MTFDEMQISSLIGVSVPTFFINDGARMNAGKEQGTRGGRGRRVGGGGGGRRGEGVGREADGSRDLQETEDEVGVWNGGEQDGGGHITNEGERRGRMAGSRERRAEESRHSNSTAGYPIEGVFVGLVGARFEQKDTMESEHIIVNDEHNTEVPRRLEGEDGGWGREGGRRQEEAGGGSRRQQEAAGSRQEAGGRRQEAGGRRQEAGGRRQEAGGRRQEAGGRRQDRRQARGQGGKEEDDNV
jgi:hypothetical protein